MDTSSNPIYGSSSKRYWSGKTYQRLDHGGFIVRKKVRVLRFGGGNSTTTTTTRRRVWKIIREIMPKKLQSVKIKSPLKTLGKLRDGYINMMLGVERKVGYLDDAKHVFGEKRIQGGRPIPSVSSKSNDFDKKLVLQVYNSFAASRELVSFSKTIV